MATGHTDPQRRERILAATLDHIAAEGVAGVSHRKIATRAGVPLGSMTYHFTGIDDLLREAFTRFADHIVTVFAQHLSGVESPEQVRKALVDLIHTISDGPQRDLVLAQELYTLAARRPEYRALTQTW
ncbi:TetR/AcrR family transcriptional regulator, partial [Streptomyces hydrogenans]